MVLSMTGYGRAQGHYNEKTITIELRSLNGKTSDIRCKLPFNYKEKELDIRKIVMDEAHRGKFDLTISTDDNGVQSDAGINKNLFKSYYKQLKELEKDLDLGSSDYTQAILRIPNVVQVEGSELDDEEWDVIQSILMESIEGLTKYRIAEGETTETDLTTCITEIQKFLEAIKSHEAPRIEQMKTRLHKIVDDYSQNTNLDRNRLEQEILFYMEKMDINEEKVRLENHCNYFLEELRKKHPLKGRKLSFIAQEIGREINTMGAKAQYTAIQKLVVKMKNELEKIKEQLANIV